MFTRRPEAIF
ncbi:unnamed protein product [Cyprideis torosa]|uniref:Uncharacterized protein n=1 Tax=Cyprideis torosa TaxID=163714 RepID=A0A7R8WPB0_9CRUS|nr:unnamed protein product [Cyprideis torosa]CAG0907111.1 unnamed protein product [Cyprideis torosa]